MTFVAALLVSLGLAAAADPGPSRGLTAHDLEPLVARARALRLAEDVGWLRLGKWRRTLTGGFRSQVDGPEFFVAPGGKGDPAAELEATLRALLAPPPRPPGADELVDPACRFPARVLYLGARLGFARGDLPPRACPKLDDYLARVAARGATLVFSSYYLNNPASAFGHTLIRLDKAGEPRAGKDAELLDYGVDYAATVDTSNALVYAAKGLFGGFHGEFKHYAYYYKVRQYGDYESRDLLEYDLALAPDEVALLAAHLWELGGTWLRYWYLDENCSYHVLGAIEAAAPRLELLRHVGKAVVLPSQTVQALFENPGLVRAVHYRPSIRTQFEARASSLRRPEAALVGRLERDPGAPLPGDLPADRQAAVLDAALDLVDLRHGRALLEGRDPEAARLRQDLLLRRAAIPVQSPPLALPDPGDLRPEHGHRTLRAGAGAGAGREAGAFARLDLRLALHDLGDPPVGYPPFAQIQFLPVRLRYYPERDRLELDDASLVEVTSLNPVHRFDLRPSWRMRAGATTVRDGGCDRCVAGALELGGGFTAARVLGVVDLLALGDVELLGAPDLAGIDGVGLRAGLGPSAIARVRAGRVATLLAEARWRWFPAAAPDTGYALTAGVRLHAGRRLSLALDARRTPDDDELSAAVLGYF
jgi:hypothetical protein